MASSQFAPRILHIFPVFSVTLLALFFYSVHARSSMLLAHDKRVTGLFRSGYGSITHARRAI